MAELTVAADADDRLLRVDVAGSVGAFYRVDDEQIQLLGQAKPVNPAEGPWYWTVARAVNGTTPAAHADDATLTALVDVVGTSAFVAPGGGAEVTGPVGSIAVIDEDGLVGTASLVYGEVQGLGTGLGLQAQENGTALIGGLGLGVQLQLAGGQGDETHVGGEVQITSGGSTGQSGGAVTITSGSDDGGGDAGDIDIQSGAATGGASGDVSIRAGADGDSAEGGSINIVAGTGLVGSGGNVVIQAGSKVTGGSHGSVQVYDGSGNRTLELNASGIFLAGGVYNFDGLPTADPEVAGQLWNNLGVLTVSAG